MSILNELTNYIKRKGGVRNILMDHWKPKLICFVLAVLVWLWVEFRYVQQSDDWVQGSEVILSLPDANF